MNKRPFLLITNDDGIHAPGLKHLWEAVSEFADAAIVAPHQEKSGCGLSITWAKPLQIRPIVWENLTAAWSLNGTPADCVKMALHNLLEKKPDLVISGVNRGSNAGRTVLYSGTVGGVIEATLKNIPGIAFSFSDETTPSVEASRPYILSLIKHLLTHPLPIGTFLNVNFPAQFPQKARGIRFAKQGKGYWIESPEKRLHPEGIPYYWLGGKWHHATEEKESDVALLEEGYITAVPIHVGELTDQAAYMRHKELFEKSAEDQTAERL